MRLLASTFFAISSPKNSKRHGDIPVMTGFHRKTLKRARLGENIADGSAAAQILIAVWCLCFGASQDHFKHFTFEIVIDSRHERIGAPTANSNKCCRFTSRSGGGSRGQSLLLSFELVKRSKAGGIEVSKILEQA